MDGHHCTHTHVANIHSQLSAEPCDAFIQASSHPPQTVLNLNISYPILPSFIYELLLFIQFLEVVGDAKKLGASFPNFAICARAFICQSSMYSFDIVVYNINIIDDHWIPRLSSTEHVCVDVDLPPPLASAATKCIIDTSPVNCPTCAVTAPSRQCNYITNFWPTSPPTQHTTSHDTKFRFCACIENLSCQRDFEKFHRMQRRPLSFYEGPLLVESSTF